MMFRVVVIKKINVRIRELIKWVMKNMMKEVKWYLEDDDCYLEDDDSYLKISFIRVKKW